MLVLIYRPRTDGRLSWPWFVCMVCAQQFSYVLLLNSDHITSRSAVIKRVVHHHHLHTRIYNAPITIIGHKCITDYGVVRIVVL